MLSQTNSHSNLHKHLLLDQHGRLFVAADGKIANARGKGFNLGRQIGNVLVNLQNRKRINKGARK